MADFAGGGGSDAINHIRHPDPVDGTAGIQTAIDELAALGGGIVYLQPGTYEGAKVTQHHSVAVEGHGTGDFSSPTTHVRLADGEDTALLDLETNAIGRSHTYCEGVFFDGNRANNPSSPATVDLSSGTEGYRFKANAVEFSANHHLLFGKAHKIAGNWIFGDTAGDGIRGAQPDTQIVGNQVGGGIGNNGIHVFQTSNSLIRGNFCYTCGNSGIKANTGTDRMTISGNRLNENSGPGISAYGHNLTVIGNVAFDNGADVSGADACGIDTFDAADCSFVGNTCTDVSGGNQEYGIYDHADFNAYVGNTLRGNATAGFEGSAGTGSVKSGNIT